MGPRTVLAVNGVDLCVQRYGEPEQPTVVLISGASTSMEMWPDALCRRLADGGHQVVRYDLRDTGESTTYGPGRATYTVRDLAEDVVGLLDALGLDQAQVVGMSMGGLVAQLVALAHPERVSRLVLVSTSPATAADDRPELPGMSPADEVRFRAIPEVDWSDPASVLQHLVAGEEACAARSVPFDQDEFLSGISGLVERSPDMAASQNHFSLDAPESAGWRLAQITAPTVVLHGDEDPVWPLPHGEALAREIPGARLVVLPRVGHEVPPRMWSALVDAVTG